MTISTNNIANWYSSGVRNPQGNPYFSSYIQNATNSVSRITTTANTPTDVPLETLVALTTYRPIILQSGFLQNPGSANLPSVQESLRKRLEAANITVTGFSNFRPSIPRSQVQSRTRTANDRRVNGVLQNLNARERILAGLDPRTQEFLKKLQDLRALRKLEEELQRIVGLLEQQIAKYTGIFNALVNSIDAAAAALLTVVIDKLDLLERAYTSAKNLVLLVQKAIANTLKALRKLLFEDIPRTIGGIKKGLDALTRLLKLPEIKLKLRFPKLPKFARPNPTFGDFFAKYRKLIQTLKDKNSGFYQKAYDAAIQQSGIEFIDPKKDKIQQGLTKARNALREARAQFEARQAARTNAIDIARTDLINQIRKNTAVSEKERQRILDQNASLQKRAKLAIANATKQVTDLASRRLYLSPAQERELVPGPEIILNRQNVLGDIPYARPVSLGGTTLPGIVPGTILETGFRTPSRQTVFQDRRSSKLYVLQSAQDRVRELAQQTAPGLNRTLAEFNSAIGTVQTAVATAAEVKANLNNNIIKAQFGAALIGQAEQVSRIQQQASASRAEGQQSTTNNVANANILFETDTFSIEKLEIIYLKNADGSYKFDATGNRVPDKTKPVAIVTSTTRRFSSAAAANQATNYNTTTAARNGYTIPLTIEASGPKTINVNGQNVYEMVVAIGYRDFNALNQARAEQLGQQQSATAFNPATVSIGTITSVPTSAQATTQVNNATPVSTTSATFTPTPATTSPGSNTAPPPTVSGYDIAEPGKLSIFEINALNNKLSDPNVSEQEKQRIRQILGVKQQLPTDLKLPEDTRLDFSQEVNRPNLNVKSSGNTATLSFNARSNSDPRVNVEYSLNNGNTWIALTPPRVSGDIVIPNLDTGIYAARIRGIRADGTTSVPSQPIPIVISISQPVIVGVRPRTSTSAKILFDDTIGIGQIQKYQFKAITGNQIGAWFDALPGESDNQQAVRSPIVVFGLETDKPHTITIRAIYADGTPGNPSNAITYTPFKTAAEGGGVIA